MNIVFSIPHPESSFEPMDMPDFNLLLPIAEWHEHAAAELTRSDSVLAASHDRAAMGLREIYGYMRQLHAILADEDEFCGTSVGQSGH
jgi:hypothetical protein